MKLAVADRQADWGQATGVPAGSQPRILLIEDDLHLAGLCQLLLCRAGYHADIAKDGEAGWEAVRGVGYQLLVTDNNLPGLTGLELIQRLRDAGEELPIIVASGNFSPEDLRQHCHLNIAAVLPKPFLAGEFLAVVRQALGEVGAASPALSQP